MDKCAFLVVLVVTLTSHPVVCCPVPEDNLVVRDSGSDYLVMEKPPVDYGGELSSVKWSYKEAEEADWVLVDNGECDINLCYISGLSANTTYTVLVVTEYTDGETCMNTVSTVVGMCTENSVTVYAQGDNWLDVRWSEPVTACLPPVKYRVCHNCSSFDVHLISEPICQEVEYKSCDYWHGMACFSLKDIPVANCTMDLQLYAIYKEDIEHPAVDIIVHLKEGAPSAPVNLRSEEITDTAFSLRWEVPSIPNGIIRQYTVTVEQSMSYLQSAPESTTMKFTEGTQMMEFYEKQVSDVMPSTEYTVTVQFETEHEGAVAQITVTTEPVKPIFSQPIQLLSEDTVNGTVILLLPPAVPNLTTISGYLLMVTEVGGACHEHGHMPVLTNMSLQIHLEEEFIDLDWNCTWIAAEPELEENATSYVVGTKEATDGTFGKEHINLNLEQGGVYQISLTAVNWQQPDVWKLFHSKLKQYIIVPEIPREDAAEVEVGDDGTNGMEYGLIAIPLLVLLPLAGYWLYLRHRRMAHEIQLMNLQESQVNIVDAGGEPSTIQEQPDITRYVNVAQLEEYVMTALASGELKRQHSLFPRGCIQPCKYGQHPANRAKNRYTDLVAYDNTRVVLEKIPDDPYSDYINANYIDGYCQTGMYIATQGPTANTVNDFWRLVWQEKVQIICMLANIWEGNKVKCEQYWPDIGKQAVYGYMSVMNTASQVFADYTVRRFMVSSMGEQRVVQQLHFTSWPDHGVPLYVQSVAAYLKQLLAAPRGDGPILVHCSAGVGRTGTIILADINLRMAAAEGAVDVLHHLKHIRQQRPNLVDNVEQYKLVHITLLECLIEPQTAIPCDQHFNSKIKKLKASDLLESQYQRLNERCTKDQTLVEYLEIGNGIDGHRSARSHLHAIPVSGFRIKKQFIVCSIPTTDIILNFWKFVIRKKISVIVVLNEAKDTPWPTTDIPQTAILDMEVSLINVNGGDEVLRHSLQIVSSGNKVPVHLLQMNGWSHEQEVPSSVPALLQLWEDAERMNRGKGPILVCCRDGVTACGLFVSLSFVLEKMKLEQVCDVCHAVRTVRQDYAKFITSLEQFIFLHDAAVEFLEAFQAYANFQ